MRIHQRNILTALPQRPATNMSRRSSCRSGNKDNLRKHSLLFHRASPFWWIPPYDSDILEGQYWRSTIISTNSSTFPTGSALRFYRLVITVCLLQCRHHPPLASLRCLLLVHAVPLCLGFLSDTDVNLPKPPFVLFMSYGHLCLFGDAACSHDVSSRHYHRG